MTRFKSAENIKTRYIITLIRDHKNNNKFTNSGCIYIHDF